MFKAKKWLTKDRIFSFLICCAMITFFDGGIVYLCLQPHRQPITAHDIDGYFLLLIGILACCPLIIFSAICLNESDKLSVH
jgi:hypothetical protein